MSDPDAESRGDAADAEQAADPEEALDADTIDALFETIEQRKRELPDDSYTASLFTHEKGQNAVLEKLGEESTELILAAKDDDRAELAAESADFLYHLLVLFSMKGMDPDDLREELESRF